MAGTTPPTPRDYRLIAESLARFLARCPPDVARKNFRATSAMYRQLTHMAAPTTPPLSRQLACDVSHEIAEFTDRATRDALLRCMRQQQA